MRQTPPSFTIAPTILSFADCTRTVSGMAVVDADVAMSTFRAANVEASTESETSSRHVIGRLSDALTGSGATASTGDAGISVRMNNAEAPDRIDAVSPPPEPEPEP